MKKVGIRMNCGAAPRSLGQDFDWFSSSWRIFSVADCKTKKRKKAENRGWKKLQENPGRNDPMLCCASPTNSKPFEMQSYLDLTFVYTFSKRYVAFLDVGVSQLAQQAKAAKWLHWQVDLTLVRISKKKCNFKLKLNFKTIVDINASIIKL